MVGIVLQVRRRPSLGREARVARMFNAARMGISASARLSAAKALLFALAKPIAALGSKPFNRGGPEWPRNSMERCS